MHSKGVTRWRSADEMRRVSDWRRFMEYALFERPEACIEALLGGAISCGVNFRADPQPHYQGNFWW